MWKRYSNGVHRLVHSLAVLLRNLLWWFNRKVCDYNVFIPEEDDYEDGNSESTDTIITVKRQRYATRFYILLLIGR